MKVMLRSFLILVCLMFFSAEAQLLKIDTVDCSKQGELASFMSWTNLVNIPKLINAWSTGPYPKIAKIGEMHADSIGCAIELFTKIVNQDSLTDSRMQIDCGGLGTRKYEECYLTADEIIELVTNWWVVEEIRKTLKLPDHQASRAEIRRLNNSKSKLNMFFLLWVRDHKPFPAVKNRLFKWKKKLDEQKDGDKYFLSEYN